MKYYYFRFGKILLPLILLLTLSASVKAQTTLVAGDIAFTGYVATSNAPANDAFSFVLLTNVQANTVIRFTDQAWGNDLVFNGSLGETTVSLTFAAPQNAGTEIIIAGPPGGSATATLALGGSAGTCVGTTLSLSVNGDQVIAYQSAVAGVAPFTFISAINMNVYTIANGNPSTTDATNWDNLTAAAQTANSSFKPTGLSTGTNAIWIGTSGNIASERNNARFNCTLATAGGANLNTAAGVRAACNNQAFWDAEFATTGAVPTWPPPSGCTFIAAPPAPNFTLHPANSTICAGANTSFIIAANNAASLKWQVDNGGGFANITDNTTYSGSATTTLNITAATNAMNGYLYRCVATNGSGPANSNNAALTVVPLPVNPTLLVKAPATSTVADGTPVSATFNPGSGGTSCVDEYRYTINGGASYLPYTPGSNISTTGLSAGTGVVTIEGRRATCTSLCQGSYIALVTWIVTPLPGAATTLNAGDLAFTAYAEANDEFSFVLLRNIGPNTVVNFTNNGWYSNNTFRTGEETVTWTSNVAYAAGTEIKIAGLSATLASGGSAGTVTGTAGGLGLSATGDQILAYRGTTASPTFITAIHMNVYVGPGDPVTTTPAAWDGAAFASPAANTNASALPTGLTTGINAIWIGIQGVSGSEFRNAAYGNCAGPGTLGSIATLRAALNNEANWIRNNNTPLPLFSIPTGCPYLGVGNPPNITGNPANSAVCELGNTSFTVTAAGATSYQWQVNPGTGFVNITDNITYSGATTATLSINAAGLNLNGYLYHAIAINGSGSSISNNATLAVNAIPVAPTLLTRTPVANNVADGTPAKATFSPGGGGTGCADDFRYSIDGGVTYLPYTPGSNISTTGVAAGSGWVFIEGRRANCSAGCQGVYKVLALWYVTPLPVAATTLNAGDVAFSSYAATTDEFSFVLIKNIGPGTVINFTTNGWYSNNTFRTGEETVTWTAPAGGMTAGTEIKIAGLTATRSDGGAAGAVTGTPLSINPTGDQILAYRGTAAAPAFIAAIHMNVYTVGNADPTSTTAATWDGAAYASPAVNVNASALPTGLTTGVNAVWIGTQDVLSSEFQNAAYGNCAGPGVLGPLTGLRAALNNQANWVRNNNAVPGLSIPTGCNYLSVLCPAISVTNPVNLNGSIGATFSETFTSAGGAPTVTYSTTSTLPTGLTLSAAGVLGGIPTQSGTFPIVVRATDGNGCTGDGAAYNLQISACAITLTSAVGTNAQTVCINTPIVDITYSTTGATGATFSGLPAGVTGSWAANVVTITGTPTTVVGSPFNYTVTPTGGCGALTATGTITVTPANTITLSSGAGTNAQTVCINTAISNITYNTTGATGATFSGLPAGVTGAWSANVITISGSPTTPNSSPFSYTVTLTGGCGTINTTGTITVTANNTVTLTSAAGTDAQSVLVNTPITNITYSTTGATGATFSGLPAGVTGNWAANVVTISGSPTTSVGSPFSYTVTLTGGCGTITANGSILINSCPVITIDPITNQVVCNNGATNTVNFGGAVAGTVYNWTNNNASVGLAASGTGNIASFTATNATAVPLTATVTVTPSYTNAGTTCAGTPITFTITVNPTPTVNAVASQVVCNGSSTTAVTFSGSVTGTVYNWTNNAPSIGLAASGIGNIAGFTATNATAVPVTATVTVTPSYTNAGTTCAGTPVTFTITVNPTTTVAAVSNQVVCNSTATTAINFGGGIPGTVYNWTNNAPSIGLAASGAGNIASFTATNATAAPVMATVTVTPSYTNAGKTCPGTPTTFTITVNPQPALASPTVTQPTCAVSSGTIVVNATGAGTLEYSIDNGAHWATTSTFGGLTVGSYTIAVRSQSAPTCVSYYSSNPVKLTAATGCICESPSSQPYIAGTVTGNQAHRGELGLEFTVNNPAGITVKQLGAFDDRGDGIKGLQPGNGVRVAIYSLATHTIVAGLDATVIGLADAYTGNHRMKNLATPVTLQPGSYMIVAKGYNINEQNGNLGNGGGPYPEGDRGVNNAISFLPECAYGPDDPSGFNYPTVAGNFGSNHQFLAGTFSFTTSGPCPAASADLTNLVLAPPAALSPGFDRHILTYTANVANTVSSVTVTPTADDPASNITVNGNTVNSGSASIPITLAEGSNTITVVVTAFDNSITKTYTVTVIKAASGQCTAPAAQAYISNTSAGAQGYRGELGMEFIVNNANGIIINQLGAFDDGGNGINGLQSGGVRVAIFNRATHQPVAGLNTVISGTAGTLSGNHRMVGIAPITLPAGDYVIVAKGYNVNERNGNTLAGTPAQPTGNNGGGAISFGSNSSYGPDDPANFNYPTTEGNFGSTQVFLAGTFNFTTVIPCGGNTTCESAPAVAYISNTNMGSQPYKGELGMQFIVNNPAGINIKQLGAFDDKGDGITGTQSGGVRVVVFNRSTQKIVPGLDVVISGNADAYTSFHRMKNITPVLLPMGDYTLVAKGYNATERNGNIFSGGGPFPAGDNAGGAITFGAETLYGPDDANGFNYPTNIGNFGDTHVFLAGTFNFTANVSCPSGAPGATRITAGATTDEIKPSVLVIQEIKVYPNPTRGQFRLQLTNVSAPKLKIDVLNASGQLVAQKTVAILTRTALLNVEFNLLNHVPGIYMIKVQSSDGVKTEKLVIQR